MTTGLLQRAERRRVEALATLDSGHQASLGQFFTPERAAQLIAGLPRLPQTGMLRVLDPGAGSGSLTAALVERVLTDAPQLSVEIVAVEIDPAVAHFARATLDDCARTASEHGATVTARVVVGDFIELRTAGMFEEALGEHFDVVIMNPPYAKLAGRSAHRKGLRRAVVDCPNLYAAFLALGADALRTGGQLVAITPRSFANGPYFEQFRRYILGELAIDRLHTFESRSKVFADTGVLQENIVLSATRGGDREKVTLSVSSGHTDTAVEHVVDYEEVVRPGDPHQFLRISAGDADTAVAELMVSMPSTLTDVDLHVSTGRVVDFRSRDCLLDGPGPGSVPLIYPGNLRNGVVEWPREIRKPQGFGAHTDKDRKLLMPAGAYVLVKRFSAKEERRRIVAAVWNPETNGETQVAFENHVNVFHSGGAGMDLATAVGLSLWLNSTAVDKFFRTFSGHTQVNATDLRSLRYPTVDALHSLGLGRTPVLPDQDSIDALVREHLLGDHNI
ncbi:Eco57I restriction-modification methylase domain-containing protein [Nocardia cyriacigeorgica]|uniref:Eco57I restriction-modification methylase domain-containing protein n=1 Tax=Nocardia cyriacigeorgica TaxID=135487 RepID=UPI001894970C|nr:Eco57I restriction-modification methylase domain-containing protein [Nocardia cyriacigeorgica]MBF6284820.1 Eco57I restriction-modification methylase domain-containing protein [Nocardia cyriacigeorgica]